MSWIKFIKGDEFAFGLIYKQNIDDLFAYGVKYHSDRDTVLDCIHDIFVDIFNNPRIAEDVNVRFYLFSSLRRKLSRVKISANKFESTLLKEDLLSTAGVEFDWIERESEQVNIARIKKQIDSLPKRQREVLFLKYYLDFSYEDISSIMDVSIETCRTLSYRAIKQLKGELIPLEFALILSCKFFL